ncbi:glycoside hydrolase family 18 protein [Candidatus Bathyarchaeota archaeon]|nr:glycoside hydrolase family 18 protein [Candidatus Bathyarchaeota archaeon]
MIPNEERKWQVEAYPKLLQALRGALDEHEKEMNKKLLITAAVPGRKEDIDIAFTKDTIPKIFDSLDFMNVMTYDLLNRRDTKTKHQSGLKGSRDSLELYIERGAPADRLNLGFPFHVKWFQTEGDCDPEKPIGCDMPLLEDPKTGADLFNSAGLGRRDEFGAAKASYDLALKKAKFDGEGTAYWDEAGKKFWTFDDEESIMAKFPLVEDMDLGGVFAWGLGQDSEGFPLVNVVRAEVAKMNEDR